MQAFTQLDRVLTFRTRAEDVAKWGSWELALGLICTLFGEWADGGMVHATYLQSPSSDLARWLNSSCLRVSCGSRLARSSTIHRLFGNFWHSFVSSRRLRLSTPSLGAVGVYPWLGP
jgi:hypothetical protein